MAVLSCVKINDRTYAAGGVGEEYEAEEGPIVPRASGAGQKV